MYASSYALHLMAIWVLILSFVLFMQLWQKLLHFRVSVAYVINVISMVLLFGHFVLTCLLVDVINTEGIEGLGDFQGPIYVTWTWGGIGVLLPICTLKLVYGILLYRRVGSALGRVEASKNIRAKVLWKIVAVVSMSTFFWLMRVTLMLVWQVQTSYGMLNGVIDFAGVSKSNQLLWQLLSQIIPFFGVQHVMLYMIHGSSRSSDQECGRESGSYVAKSYMPSSAGESRIGYTMMSESSEVTRPSCT